MSAYYLKQAVKEWSLGTIYKGMADFMVIQCIAVALVLVFPGIAMWLPDWLEAHEAATAPLAPAEAGQSEADRNSLEAGDQYKDGDSGR
jgi:hypothetical protein